MPEVTRLSFSDVRRPLVQDTLIAIVIAALSLISMWSPPTFIDYEFRDPDALGVSLAVLGSATVVLRSKYPVSMLILGLVTTLPLIQLGYNQTVGGVPALLAMYTIAVQRSLAVSASAAVATLVAVGSVLYAGPLEPTPGDWLGNGLILGLVWTVGRSVHNRRARLATLATRDRALASAEAANQRTAAIRQRTVVAQELQDVVAHCLTEITVQMAAARRMIDSDPTLAARTLGDAEASGRAALQEMRRLFTLLAEPDDEAQLRPLPRLDAIEDLVDAERGRGADVVVIHEGAPRELAPGLALTAYRIVEEALANARQHAGAGKVTIRLKWFPEEVTLSVSDDGPGPPISWPEVPPRPPGGLERVAERVRVYGGDLHWGPHDGGGFSLTAELPLNDTRSRT